MIARILAAAILVLLAALAVQTTRLHRAQMQVVTLRLDAEQARLDATTIARHAEQRIAAAAAQAAEQYEKGKQDAQAAADAVVADLNAGTLKLRHEWAGCETSRLSESATATRELDAANQRRAELAADIVRVGATCDAKERTLISAYDGARAAVNGVAP